MQMAAATALRLPMELLLLLYKEEMFSIHTVHEWLWGYEDKFLRTLNKVRPDIDPVFGFFNKVSFLFILIITQNLKNSVPNVQGTEAKMIPSVLCSCTAS